MRQDTFDPVASAAVEHWDYEADVLIVGFGAAGSCAAIEASRAVTRPPVWHDSTDRAPQVPAVLTDRPPTVCYFCATCACRLRAGFLRVARLLLPAFSAPAAASSSLKLARRH